jgi:hypothetical protein
MIFLSGEEHMAGWVRPKFTPQEVDHAGRILIAKGANPADLGHALEVINNWRIIHSYPLNATKVVLTSRARAVQPTVLISRRIKRLPAIQQKLRRMRKILTLSEMQDVGGCRAVVASVQNVRKVVAIYKQKRRGALHELIDEDDYISERRLRRRNPCGGIGGYSDTHPN